jgi:hypothetical protein
MPARTFVPGTRHLWQARLFFGLGTNFFDTGVTMFGIAIIAADARVGFCLALDTLCKPNCYSGLYFIERYAYGIRKVCFVLQQRRHEVCFVRHSAQQSASALVQRAVGECCNRHFPRHSSLSAIAHWFNGRANVATVIPGMPAYTCYRQSAPFASKVVFWTRTNFSNGTGSTMVQA